MRRLFVTVVGLLVVFATIWASGAYSQTPPTSTGTNQPPAKAKVVFHYGRPVPINHCLEQAAIQIDGATVHELFQWHVWQTEVAPGIHVFSDDSHKDKGSTASLAAGQTYYYELEWHKGFGFPKCENFWIKFEDMKPKEIQKVSLMLGKPNVDETTAAAASPAAAAAPVAAAEPPKNTNVTLSIRSTPEAADIEVDGSFVGSTPSAIDLATGEHTVIISKKGFEPWKRTIKLASGDIKVNAELEKASGPAS
ncbi:MAG TPA: PEGA domain-containing protein [Candidatus Acidoferrum sp.]|nr:PEGA domain-containing protein [Candidatus Acidoferrum sp.]